MNLIIDAGNTQVKAAVFQQNEIIYRDEVSYDALDSFFEKLLQDFDQVDHAILSSVARVPEKVVKNLSKKVSVLQLSHETRVPFENCYTSPETLGVDRIALVVAATMKYPGENVLVIDAGTCVTFDFKNENEQYVGGAISPGIRMRYQSLNDLTANLPLLDTDLPKSYIGDSTANSIHSGVVNGILREIEGVIDQYLQEFQHLTVILTGGDALFLSKSLKNSIFANSNFLLEGLNFIVEYNKN